MKYYEEHAKEYIASTINTDMGEVYAMAEKYVPDNGSVLDVGFGSGRDMLFFQNKGYRVFGIDNCEAFVKHAKEMGLEVELADLLCYDSKRKYDLIWCCASLLHLKKKDVFPAITKYLSFLSDNGVLFLSMKFANKEDGVDEKGRYFSYFNEKDLNALKRYTKEISFNSDKTREGLVWVNLILESKKK